MQVFIIAAREFLDFAVFLFYILVLLGSAVFAFFQLTGGNFQFLRFPDGLSLMSRLTFGEQALCTLILVVEIMSGQRSTLAHIVAGAMGCQYLPAAQWRGAAPAVVSPSASFLALLATAGQPCWQS